MNFFILTWNFKIGGVQKHTVLLANYLTQLGWNVTIVYSNKDGELLNQVDPRVSLIPFKIPSTNNLLKLFRLSRSLKAIVPKGALILCNGPNNFRQIGRINWLVRNWKLLFILQNDLDFQEGSGSFFKQMEMRFICNAPMTHIVALSSKQKRDHQNRLGLKNMKVIPNFIDFDHEFFTTYDTKQPKGVSVGRYASQKGYDVLLEAMKHLNEEQIVDVYGYGDEERIQLETRVKKYGLKNISFFGPILNVYEVISKYDYFILSSRFEPFGIVVAEALSCGLPVVTTDCDGPLDIINKDNGIVVERENPIALAKGIQELLDKLKSKDFHNTKVRASAQRYSISYIVSEYLTFLGVENSNQKSD